MEEDIITYENLYETLRKEKYKKELQPLDKDFYRKVAVYLQEKQDILNTQQGTDTLFSNQVQKTRKQIENTQKILKELYERRETKIIQLAIFSSRTSTDTVETSDMLEEETEFYKKFIKHLNSQREANLYNLIKVVYNNKPKEIKAEESSKAKTVRFIQPIPKFVGEDLTVYGPFEEEDMANLPLEIADLLIKNKKAEEL